MLFLLCYLRVCTIYTYGFCIYLFIYNFNYYGQQSLNNRVLYKTFYKINLAKALRYIVQVDYLQIEMYKTLKFNLFKRTIGMNKRGLWQWIDDTFNRQVFFTDDC